MMRILFRFMVLINFVMLLSACSTVPVASIDNMKMSITMLSDCHVKYSAFADVALNDNLVNIANLFTAIAQSEKIQCDNQYNILCSYVKVYQVVNAGFETHSTFENLKASAANEEQMFQVVYPKYNAVASNENLSNLQTQFHLTSLASVKHANLFNYAARVLSCSTNDLLVASSWSVCPSCGFVCNTSDIPSVCDDCQRVNGDLFLVFN